MAVQRFAVRREVLKQDFRNSQDRWNFFNHGYIWHSNNQNPIVLVVVPVFVIQTSEIEDEDEKENEEENFSS